MSNDTQIPALRICDSGTMEPATIGRVPGTNTYADRAGNILTDTGRISELMGWGELDGQARVLADEFGRDAYCIKATA